MTIRLFDIFFSGIALLILSPIFLVLIIVLKFTGEGKIFFLQERVGKSGEYFKLFKFVTMIENSSNVGTGTITIENDPRILPLGHILRRTKLNELPQLLNVLLGDMSVIGPRPQTKRCFNAFPEASKEAIKKVKPGLSGIGSIFFRNEESMYPENCDYDDFYNKKIMAFKGRLEEWYVSNNNLLNYFLFIFMTLKVLLFPKIKFIWTIYKDLPLPPKELEKWFE